MLHCNMIKSPTFHRSLQALLAELQQARAQGDLGKLALLCYCELRRWAREAGESELAAHCTGLITGTPHPSRQAFLSDIDALIDELATIQDKFALPLLPPLSNLPSNDLSAPVAGAVAG